MDCGGCTECCELFHIDSKKATNGIIESVMIESPAGVLCDHCDKNVGCKVHEERPKICRDFLCSYAQQNNAPIELRPDKCGVIFEKLDDDMFVGTLRPNQPISEFGMNQIRAFNKQGFNVVLTKHSTIEPHIMLAERQDKFKVLKKFLGYRRIADGKYTNN